MLTAITLAPPLPGLGKLQTFLCVTYVGTDAVVGCSSGELYRFKGRQLVQVVQVSSTLIRCYYIHQCSICATAACVQFRKGTELLCELVLVLEPFTLRCHGR
jgi:hypothetical protein